MPRGKRNFIDEAYYHIINRGNGKQQIFHSTSDYRAFVSWVIQGKNKHNIHLHAFCLMPNHFHFLLQPMIGTNLSKYMHWVMDKHIHNHRRIHNTVGHIWQGPYKDFIIQEDRHYINVLRYIEGNPVRAALAKSASDWIWSSHRERIGFSSEGKFLNDGPLSLPNDWKTFVDSPLAANELTKIRYSVKRGAPYGNKEWQVATAERLGISNTLRPRGRPPKKQQ